MNIRSIVIAAAITLAAPPAFAKTFTHASIGEWKIYVYFKDDGSFGHCSMGISSRSGSESLTIIAGPSGYKVFLDGNSWSLNKGDQYPSIIAIGKENWSGNAVVYADFGVVMNLSYSTGFGEAFAAGTRMDFTIGKKSMTLNLEGSRRALDGLMSCLNKYEPNTNPFGDPTRKTKNPFD